jgi:NAD+ diphosphatase
VRIDTGSVTFVGSQPWPFPQSTMLGFRATAATDTGALVVDTNELVEASWFDRATVAAATAASGPTGDPRKTEVAAAIDPSLRLLVPPEGVLARTLIEAWLAGR